MSRTDESIQTLPGRTGGCLRLDIMGGNGSKKFLRGVGAGDNENVLKLLMVVVAQLYKHKKP